MIHPFLLAVFPILALFAPNSSQVLYSELYAPIAWGLLATLLVWLAASVLLYDMRKAGMFATLGLVTFWLGSRFPQDLDDALLSLSIFWVRKSVHVSPRISVLLAVVVIVPVGLVLAARLRYPAS